MIGLRGVPATYGGVERAVEELGAELVAQGHEVTVFCRAGYTSEKCDEHRGMRLRHQWAPKQRGLEALVHSGLASVAVLRGGYDVVHFHAMGPGLFAPIVKALSGSAVVQTIHGMDNERAKWGTAGKRTLDVAAWISSRVPDATIVVSHELARVYASKWRRRTTVVPNGVRPPVFNRDRDVLRALGVGDDENYLLWLGRIVPEKRPDLLIDAFRKVPSSCKLVLVGGSSHTDEYAEQVRAAAESDDRIVLAGFRYGAELQQLFSHASCFVMPSDLEGLPLTLLEAVSYQLPVVASDIPPHWEVLGTPGPGRRSFAGGDLESLVEQLTIVVSDLQAEARAARSWSAEVLRAFDWPEVARRTAEVYATVWAPSAVVLPWPSVPSPTAIATETQIEGLPPDVVSAAES